MRLKLIKQVKNFSQTVKSFWFCPKANKTFSRPRKFTGIKIQKKVKSEYICLGEINLTLYIC